jgi:ribosomal protein S18 acetylase RimI-like enzyme
VTAHRPAIQVRPTRPEDFPGIIALSRRVYPDSPSWTEDQLASHLRVFPQGQLVAVDSDTGEIVGMAASLIVLWDDYEMHGNWRNFTDSGYFTNHDPDGHTLYGAEVMVDPTRQRQGIGRKLYAARRELTERLGLRRIRAGARLRGYHVHAGRMPADEYVRRIVAGTLQDPTLSFQLQHGFRVLAVIPEYLRHDPESLGWAAVIEWINPRAASPEDQEAQERAIKGGGLKTGH